MTATVGSLLTKAEQLDSLPQFAVVLADPDGRSAYADDRRLAMQKRPDDDEYSYWHLGQEGQFSVMSSDEAVRRFRMGPFLVIWLPTTDASSMSADTCPPLYVPTRSECNAMKDQSRSELLAAGINPERWNLDAIKCSHGDGPSDHIEDVETAGEAA